MLREQDRQFESLRADVQEGFDQLERGEGIELDDQGLRDLFDDIQARGKQRYEAAKKTNESLQPRPAGQGRPRRDLGSVGIFCGP